MGSSLTLKPSEVKTFDEIKTLVEEYSEESKEILEDVERVEELPVEKYSEESREASEYYERFEQLLETLTELKEIKADCSQPNWEGEDELPITEATEAKARKLLFLAARLQNLIELPTVTPTASGYIELEWYKEKGHRFVVRLNGHGRFIYAG
ncbi:MAG: hypothetical protein IIA62_04795, partial [Nitrospinae bacterium]|nr:hypothetical protein [Nitrospinota bacterium]